MPHENKVHGVECHPAVVDAVFQQGELEEYALAYAVRADFCRRLGMESEARQGYERALALTKLGSERRFLMMRLGDLGSKNS